jgi:hypothetical protein
MSGRLKFGSVAQPVLLCLLFAATSPVSAQAPQPSPASSAPAAVADADEASRAKTPHEAMPRVSKFEARRIRHACRERANERGVKGSEREAFLSRCLFGRRVGRKERRECAKFAAAQGLDKAAQRDFVRECLREQRARSTPE